MSSFSEGFIELSSVVPEISKKEVSMVLGKFRPVFQICSKNFCQSGNYHLQAGSCLKDLPRLDVALKILLQLTRGVRGHAPLEN